MRIEVDCERIRRNTEAVVKMCTAQNIAVVGVTKACCGHPEVARAMLAGGVSMLAESRLNNVRRLRDGGIDIDIMLLRLPCLSEVEEVVQLTQVSLNSQVETARALSHAAQAYGVTHQVMLMVETGDRREGVMPSEAVSTAREMLTLPHIELVGIATNVSCIGGVLPTQENTQLLVDTAESVEQALGIQLQVVSGGHTASLALIERGEMPSRVNQLRIGEGILLGIDSAGNWPLPSPYQDAFNVVAEVVEVETKPSLPEGPITVDAFGRTPHWEDVGIRQRAILAIGEQDLRIDGLRPKRPGVTLVGASSDHLVVDVTEVDPLVCLGDELEFDPTYAAVATGMASLGVTQVTKPMAGQRGA
jgi:predicted amino acid racemase